ncbi:hypothetical protein [Paenibacillus illinoisensis]|uniref:Uncharacterized protein n=1 Tax=Paenibacillus illinoisensis TaxID=59845 RepID=A0A2W0C6I5_9BACL|nr:Uncharacterized protein PIL02S_05278 [Paenibacillus illinoisensis]
MEPIFWNERTGNMVGGYQRYKIMVNELAMTELQVSVVDLDELQESGADLTLPGLNQEEFEDLIAEFGTIPDTEIEDPVVEDDFDVQGALDNIQDPETQRGDIWQLGPHRLMCGDSTNEEDVGCLMDGELAALVVTDPPYNVDIESNSARLAADGCSSIQNDDMPADEFVDFLHAVFERMLV